jgi:hypothetical protein
MFSLRLSPAVCLRYLFSLLLRAHRPEQCAQHRCSRQLASTAQSAQQSGFGDGKFTFYASERCCRGRLAALPAQPPHDDNSIIWKLQPQLSAVSNSFPHARRSLMRRRLKSAAAAQHSSLPRVQMPGQQRFEHDDHCECCDQLPGYLRQLCSHSAPHC